MSIDLDGIGEEDLLNVKICDLPLKIEGTWLESCIQGLYQELEVKNISFRPVCYLADEWLTPENEPVIGIPFYLAHPALIRLEKKMMLEAEGETVDSCMQLLRHETGHAICYAYRLNKKERFRKTFGSSAAEYSETYRYRPYSKNFVRHLEGFYAQYHPDEDFVETFAVWLTPGLDWAGQYRGWTALKKLQYIDQLMASIRHKESVIKKGRQFWNFRTIKATLRHYYQKKRSLRAEDFPDFHDGNLKRIFDARGIDPSALAGLLTAADFIKRHHTAVVRELSLWTGEKKYVVNDLLKDIVLRCRELKLVVPDPETAVMMRLTGYVTALVMNYVYTGWYRGDKKKRKH